MLAFLAKRRRPTSSRSGNLTDSSLTYKTTAGLSPEHSVSTAEPMPDIQMSDSSSDLPDELYNLTKLAEVAVATGQILNQQLRG